jgi:hypothetical protein
MTTAVRPIESLPYITSIGLADQFLVNNGSTNNASRVAVSTLDGRYYTSNNIATQAQAQAGTNNTTLMTPLRVSDRLGPTYIINASPTAIATSKMGINWYWKDASTYNAENEGALWTASTYSGFVFHKEFTSANTPGAGNGTLTGGPCTTLFAFANNISSSGDVCAMIADTTVSTASATGFGANILARNEAGINSTKLVGLEIDIMPATGTTVSSSSCALVYNVFNTSSQACISLAGGVNSGTWANGHLTSHIRGAHYAVNTGDPTTADSFIDTRNGTFNIAFRTGVGASYGFAFGTGAFAAMPFIWAPTTTNIGLKPGTGGFTIIYRADGSTQNLTINEFGNLNFPNNGNIQISGTQVVQQRDTGWTAMTGSSDKATSYATGTVTLAQLAGRVMAMQAALTAHGLIGA